MVRQARVNVHVPIRNLLVASAWEVGGVTFRPSCWLKARIARLAQGAEGMHADYVDRALAPIADWRWATAEVRMPVVPKRGADVGLARDLFRDAIAVLRVYQRARVPALNLDDQTFGVVGDIGSELAYSWQTGSKSLHRHGWMSLGIAVDFQFTRAQQLQFLDRPAFRFLDRALATTEDARTAWQRRAIAATRALNTASAMLGQPLRIALQAVALEALLGDDPPANGEFRPQAHLVAQRAAFLTCPVDGLHLPPKGRLCACLTASTASSLSRNVELSGRPPDFWDWPCTEYWHIREIFAKRNEALHEARDVFQPRTAVRYEGRVDDVLLAALDWVEETRAAELGDLLAVIKAAQP